VHHYGALGASIREEGGERFICALCEGLIQRVLTRFYWLRFVTIARLAWTRSKNNALVVELQKT
jgi:hypothetical protein